MWLLFVYVFVFCLGTIVVPMILIVVCCYASLAVPKDEVADRLSVSVTLMLATVAFKFVITNILPPVSYLTWMDRYITINFVVIALFVAENATAWYFDHEYFNGIFGIKWLNFDVAFFIFITTTMVFTNVFFIFALNTNVFRYSWQEMDRQDRENEDDDFVSGDAKYILGPFKQKAI